MKTYSSTITSKGTITLPANLRHKLGLNSGGKVFISLQDNNFIIRPQGSWDDFFKTRDKIAQKLPNKFINNQDLPNKVEESKIKFYKNKFNIK